VSVYDDILPQVVWTKNLIEKQGFIIKKNIVYQGNSSVNPFGIKLMFV
jgi:hypothetical protein